MKILLKSSLICTFLFLMSASLQAQLSIPKGEIQEKTSIDKKVELRQLILSDNIQISQDKNHFLLKYNPAFFCEIEDKIEATSKIPLRFRLGTLDMVDSKECKASGFVSKKD